VGSVSDCVMPWLPKLLRCDEDDDRDWRRQNVGDSPLYDFINLQDTGKLVDVFDNKHNSPVERSEALNSIIRHEIVRFLYDGGRGKVVRNKCSAFAPQASVRIDDTVACACLYHFECFDVLRIITSNKLYDAYRSDGRLHERRSVVKSGGQH